MSDTPDNGFDLGDTDGAGPAPAGTAAASYGLSSTGKVVSVFAGETHAAGGASPSRMRAPVGPIMGAVGSTADVPLAALEFADV